MPPVHFRSSSLVVALAASLLCSCNDRRVPAEPVVQASPGVETGPAVVTREATPEISAPAPTPAPADVLRRAIEAAMPLQSAACLAHTQSSKPHAPVAVHRWVDAAGITHYSDQAPPANARDQRVIAMVAAPVIVVQASGYDVDLPNQLQQRAVADALGVQRLMHDALGVPVPVGMTLKIVFVRSEQAYARVVGEPALAKSSGAYSTADRTIHVRMQEAE